MKLIMTLLVRDEEDIVEANIRYHLARGVDFIIATDNLSRDRTPEILRRYRQQGRLHLIEERDDNYAQSRWVTRMARLACEEFGADWVINNDADEFWWPESGADLKAILAAVPPDRHAVLAPRHNFPVRPERPGSPFFDVMTVREVQSLNPLGQPLIGKVCHRAFPDIVIDQGNHHVRRDGTKLEPVPAGICIFHYPVRSYAQFANKIALGGAAYARNDELPPHIGITWRLLYERYQRGELPEYYRQQELGGQRMQAGLAAGTLVHDARLRDFMRNLTKEEPFS